MNLYLDAELIDSLRAGNEKAFEHIIEQFQSTLKQFCRVKLKDSRDVEEAVADVFILLWRYREKIKDADHLKSWLFLVAEHRCIDRKKAMQQNPPFLLSDTSEPIELSKSHIDIMLQFNYLTLYEDLYESIEDLPEELCTIVKMKIREGYSTRDIARKMNLTWHRVHYLIRQATKLLKKTFTQGKALSIALVLVGF